MTNYDCIVIGSGIGGLMAAGRLASKGAKVLVLEKNKTPGGYLQSFSRKGATFDSCVDCFSGLDGNGPITHLLEVLGVRDELDIIKVDPIRTSIFPTMTVKVHAELARYIEELKGFFPHEAKGIDSFFVVLFDIYSDIKGWGEGLINGRAREGMPLSIMKYRAHSFAQLLDDHITDAKLKAVLSDRCPFIGLPPGEVSAVAMTALMMSYFSGAYRIKGGGQGLADAVVRGIRRKGGEVLFDKEVVAIGCEGGAASSVTIAGGEQYGASHIISNCDYITTTGRFLEACPEAVATVKGESLAELSSSFFILYMLVDIDLAGLGDSSSIGYYPSFDMAANFGSEAAFSEASSIGITIPTILDPGLAPDGRHIIIAHEMTSFDYTDSWRRDKAALGEKVLLKAARAIPGLIDGVIFKEAATPATLKRYTGGAGGAAYGWRQTTGLRPVKSPVKGLSFAGHWEGIGGGVLAAAYSGLKAACEVEELL
jgi:phytoene dehydrogenase-like protein